MVLTLERPWRRVVDMLNDRLRKVAVALVIKERACARKRV
jgi:hypothetical protein